MSEGQESYLWACAKREHINGKESDQSINFRIEHMVKFYRSHWPEASISEALRYCIMVGLANRARHL